MKNEERIIVCELSRVQETVQTWLDGFGYSVKSVQELSKDMIVVILIKSKI